MKKLSGQYENQSLQRETMILSPNNKIDRRILVNRGDLEDFILSFSEEML
jgi:hypothetical protein